MQPNKNPVRTWVELWRYDWSYKKLTNEFRVFKIYYQWNGKKKRHIKGRKTETVYSCNPSFEVKEIEREISRTKYDFGAWSVSEQSWEKTETIKEYDKTELEYLFYEVINELPPQPQAHKTTA